MTEKQKQAAAEMLSGYSKSYLKDMKKDYQKMKTQCNTFEDEHRDYCRRISLDMDALNFDLNPEHPPQGVFQTPGISENDQKMVGEYMRNREKMYLLEKCVSAIKDETTRQMAKMYYLERKGMPQIAEELGCGTPNVSKKLSKAEQGAMLETIDNYFSWKYEVTGGNVCYWAGEWEQEYMRLQDTARGIVRIAGLNKTIKDFLKPMRMMGLLPE